MEVSSSPPRTTQICHQVAEHSANAFAAINRMRLSQQLCDVTISIGQSTLHAHKVVLAACSPYFHAMFNNDMAERTKTDVTIHDLDPVALELLVDYSYKGEIVITEENVQVLLPAASLLQMSCVREACCKFLLRQLHPSNCLGIRSFADTHACKDLYRKSHHFAIQNFEEVIQTEEFLMLPLQEVEDLIANDALNVSTEERVYLAALAWVKHDLEKRSQHVARLMQHVRLPLISREFLTTHVDDEPLVRDTPECKDLLIEAMKYHLLPEKRSCMSTAAARTRERNPEGIKPYLFAVGGGSLFAINSECECYNPRTDRWIPIAPLNLRRSRAGAAALSRLLYVVGGYDGAADLASSESYNPITNKWTVVTPMGTRRSCLGVCSLHGLLYAVGGYDGASCLGSVERYDPLVNCWTSVAAMHTRRRYCRLAILDGCIYSVGGYDGTNYQASAERLDPRLGKWMPVPNMLSRRSSCGVASLDGLVYAIGGNDGSVCACSAERFNSRRNGWEPIASMHCRRSTHDVVAVDGMLYAVGGNDGNSSLNSVERYDQKLNKWVMVTSMLTRRSSVGAAILDCLNMETVLGRNS